MNTLNFPVLEKLIHHGNTGLFFVGAMERLEQEITVFHQGCADYDFFFFF
jgi:hypothetical protein